MTEKEASTKWCPMYRTSGVEAADNRPWQSGTGTPPSVGKIDMRVAGCIGSACMWWRTELRSETIRGRKRSEDHIAHDIVGWCGPAGKP